MKISPQLAPSSQTTLQQLNKKTAHYIEAAQVIPGISACVKELIENSIDAGATSVTIKLLEYGKKGLIVTDNGHGISEGDFENITKKHATSKIESYADIEVVSSFGFRGEALASICAMADVSIVTKTDKDTLATKLSFDDHGRIMDKSQTARATGTMITLENMFKHFPVRQKHQRKNYKKEYLKCLSTIQSYALISENVRITSYNVTKLGKQPTTDITTRGKNLKDNIIRVFGSKNFQKLEPISFKNDSYNVQGYISLPKQNHGRSSSDRQFLYFHKRPVNISSITKIINEKFRKIVTKRYPIFIINIVVSNSKYDVNLNPDKKSIFIQEQQRLLEFITDSFDTHWAKVTSTFDRNSTVSPFTPLSSSESDSPFSSSNQPVSLPISTPSQSTPSISSFGLSQHMKNPTKKGLPKQDNLKSSTIFDYGFKPVAPTTTPKINSNTKIEEVTKSPQLPRIRERDEHNPFTIAEQPPKKKLKTQNIFEAYQEQNGNRFLMTPKEVSLPQETNLSQKISHGSCDCSDKFSDLMGDEGDDDEDEKDYVNEEKSLEDDTSLMYQKDHLLKATFDESLTSKTIAFQYKHFCNSNRSSNSSMDSSKSFFADLDPNAGALAEAELSRSITKDDFMRMEVIGQFNKGFIIAKLDKDLFILDQHACDEIYNFETLQQSTILNRQPLIQPIPLELPAADEHIVMDNLPIFEKSGFSFKIDKSEPVSQRVLLKSVPHSKNAVFDERDVSEMIFMLHEHSATSTVRPSKVRAMFASRACRKSVMVGTSLSKPHMKKIVNHMNIIENPWQCPHGRPTMRHLLHLPDVL